jgi:hypothetical protein
VHGSRIDWTLYYTEEELRDLKLKHIKLREVPNHKNISIIDSAVCDSALVSVEGNPRVTDEVIKKRQLFESLEAVKFFYRITQYGTIGHSMLRNQIKLYVILYGVRLGVVVGVCGYVIPKVRFISER